ncbi:CrcB family protein [Halobacteria archaeon AArc-dxtr1]|nr:CrcB family protein [Halobacteria archaeon AArc-dxtr1]
MSSGLVAAVADLLASLATAIEPEPAHLVGTGGAVGALLRHWVYLYVPQDEFPTATLAVNVLGSFVFGAAVFAGAGTSMIQLLGIGICGSFTTFSSFSVETVQLWERGDRRLAAANAAANLLVSLAAIGLAWLVVASIV